MPALTIKRIGGLSLGRTPSQEGELRVVRGRNFMPFLEGPRSYFGNSVISNSPFKQGAKYPATFSHNGTFVYMDETGIYQLNTKCLAEKVFSFECVEQGDICDFEYPWSHAYVGDSYFYAHPAVGLIEYDAFKNEWCQHSRKALGFSDLIFSITEANGSLIVQSRDTVTWSEFDNGHKLIENEYTGAGSQSTHLAGSGRPLGVFSDGQGFFTVTSNGVMYSRPLSSAQIVSGENVEGMAVFRHDKFDADSLPFSPFAITNISESLILFLGNKGLQQMGRFDNNQFTQKTFAPVMSRWLREKYLKCEDVYTDTRHTRLFYDKGRNWLFMSFSHNNNCVYNESLVYDLELEEWGSFNHEHTLIGNFTPRTQSNVVSRLGYIDPLGYTHLFDEECRHTISAGGLHTETSINSFIDIGYIRPDNQEDSERLYSLEGFTIETNQCHTNFKAEVFGADGECDYASECASVEPYLHSKRNCANYYVCSNLGNVHILRITANALNECFWIKLIRLNFKQRGKI